MSHLCQRNHRHHCNDRSVSNTLNHPLPLVVSSYHTMAVSFSPPSPVLPMGVVVSPTLAEHSSLTGHWFWTGMIQLADHGWWTSTASPVFGANTHRGQDCLSSCFAKSVQSQEANSTESTVRFIKVILFN